ncbi:MAG: hypothetical protein AAF734_07620, partial [Bacteroidota bacterium]
MKRFYLQNLLFCRLLFCIASLLWSSLSWGQSECNNWQKISYIEGSCLNENTPSKLITDDEGNSYIYGRYQSELTLNGTPLVSTGEGSFLAKVDAEGTLLWSKRIQNLYTFYNDYVIVLDRTGDHVFIMGSFFQGRDVSFLDDGNEQVIGSRKRSTGTLVMKYSKEGQLVWKLRGEEQEPLYSDNPQ